MAWVVDCPIIMHQEVAPGHYRLAVKAPDVARVAQPGAVRHACKWPGRRPWRWGRFRFAGPMRPFGLWKALSRISTGMESPTSAPWCRPYRFESS